RRHGRAPLRPHRRRPTRDQVRPRRRRPLRRLPRGRPAGRRHLQPARRQPARQRRPRRGAQRVRGSRTAGDVLRPTRRPGPAGPRSGGVRHRLQHRRPAPHPPRRPRPRLHPARPPPARLGRRRGDPAVPPHPGGRVNTVADLFDRMLAETAPAPAAHTATSVFWLHHGTRLAGGDTTYLNHYVLVRSGGSFGACAFEPGEVDPAVCAEASGRPLADLMRTGPLPLRLAALDACLARSLPHRDDPRAEAVPLPAGTPERRALARDAAVAGLLDLAPGAKVALIGVVNPLVAAIRDRGGECLPCDRNLRATRWGDPVTPDMD